MSNYYTPTIEEFHVGFEYEIKDWIDNNRKFVWNKKEIIRPFQISSVEMILRDIKMDGCSIRVKYLELEDIEPIWITSDKGFTTKLRLRMDCDNNDVLTFQTYWMESHEYLDDIYLYWDVNYNTIKITRKSRTLFWGIIKNKSELKVLLKQLGIND